MPLRNYQETDIAFYSQEKIKTVESQLTRHGVNIRWQPIDGVSGYAIYRREIGTENRELLVTIHESLTEYDDLTNQSGIYEYEVFGIIEGDIILDEMDEEGLVDFALTKEYESPRQDILNRIRTQTGDWRSHPDIGGDLELLEGEPNTRETGARGVEQIRRTLTYDGRFLEEDLQIRAVPTDIDTIEFYTLLDTDETKPFIVTNTLNL